MARAKLPLAPMAVYGLLKELRTAAQKEPSLAVGGARELVAVLRRELERGATAGAVREASDPRGAAALAYVLAGDPTPEDEERLRAAARARVPIVAVATRPVERTVPHVLATDIVRVPPGSGFPVDEIARALAAKLDEDGAPLAARVPVLRRAVSEALIARFARQNAILGAAVFVPGADLPVLTLNQLRLVLRLGLAHGFTIDRERLPEVLAVVGGGLGLRALARQALGVVPVAGWAVKGAVAYLGTRALGEAALRYFEARSSVEPPPATPTFATRPPPAEASPASP